VKRIPLTQGKFALVDDRFYEPLMAMGSWSYHPSGRAQKWYKGKTVQMHRVIWAMAGRPLPEQLDHRDRNALNNQLRNLRPATPSQNMANHGPSKRNTSGYKGVWWRRDRQRWCAKIQVNGTQTHIGYFEAAKEAAAAYDKAAKKHFGEFAYLNLAS